MLGKSGKNASSLQHVMTLLIICRSNEPELCVCVGRGGISVSDSSWVVNSGDLHPRHSSHNSCHLCIYERTAQVVKWYQQLADGQTPSPSLTLDYLQLLKSRTEGGFKISRDWVGWMHSCVLIMSIGYYMFTSNDSLYLCL